jgi:hypothetical protein
MAKGGGNGMRWLAPLWHWVLLPLLVCMVLAVPAIYYYADDELCRLLEAKLVSSYPHLQISVRSALLVPGEGIQIRGIALSDRRLPRPFRQLAYIDECWLACGPRWEQLLHGKLDIQRVRLLRPRLRLTRLADGSWSAAGLWPLPRLSDRPPPLTIEGGTLELYDVRSPAAARYVLRNICLSVARQPATPSPRRSPSWSAQMAGTLLAPHARSLSFDATLLPDGQGEAEIRYEGLELSTELASLLPELAASLPPDLPVARAELEGRAQLRWHARQPAVQLAASGTLQRGTLSLSQMPWPLTDVRASFRYDDGELHLQGVTARFGQASLHLDHARVGFSPHLRYEVQGQCRRLRIDPRLVEALPSGLRRQCHRYRPTGDIDIRHFLLGWDGQGWKYAARVQCLSVGLTYHRFPYALDDVQGTLELEDNVLQADLKAPVDGDEVRIQSKVHVPRVQPGDWLEIRTGRVTLSEKLLAALDDKCQSFARSLQPQGRITAMARFEWGEQAPRGSSELGVASQQPESAAWSRSHQLEQPPARRLTATEKPPGQAPRPAHGVSSAAGGPVRSISPLPPMQRTIAIKFQRCNFKYARFPYGVEDVWGTVTLRGGTWHVDRLEGRHGSGRIVCTGQVELGPKGAAWRLWITGQGLALNEELRAALNPANQRLWDAVSPRGACDVEALLLTLPGERQPRLRIRARPVNNEAVVTALEPRPFPYRLERVEGLFTFQDGALHFERMRARHGRTLLSARGFCRPDSTGGWRLHFHDLAVDQLAVDRDLLEAVHGKLNRALSQVRLRGTLSLHGQLEVTSAPAGPSMPGQPSVENELSAAWDMSAELHDVSLDCGWEVEHLFGGLTLTGRYAQQRLAAHGELALESASHGDYQVTQLRGPFWLDEGQVLLGVWADRHRRVLPQRHLTCQAYGGSAQADLWVKLEPQPRFAVNLTISDADLARLAREALPGSQRVAGRIMATLELRGRGRSRNYLGGHGTLSLLEADLYELPQMVALLKLLSVRPPDPTAFTESHTAFRVVGEHVYFDDFRLCGDAISLLGKGEMDLNQRLNLTLHAMVGRQRQHVPLWSEIIGGASQQIMLIHVGGTLADVELRREPFPVVSHAVQQLHQGLRR